MTNTIHNKLKVGDIYNPFRAGLIVENIIFGEIARIIDIDDSMVTLQLGIDKDLNSSDYIDLEYGEFRKNWKISNKKIESDNVSVDGKNIKIKKYGSIK